ncbi:MAG: FlgD immunoglobulin-like domain containing protein, partial [Bacteroidota bacterium]
GNAPLGQRVKLTSLLNEVSVRVNDSLPYSLGPLCADGDTNSTWFEVVATNDGYIALKDDRGNFVKADPERYGYVYTQADEKRGDDPAQILTEAAKFIWVDLEDGKAALYSKALGLYLRTEQNTGPNMPLYAASNSVGVAETFSVEKTEVEEAPDDPLLFELTLLPPQPNPVYERTSLAYYLREKGHVEMDIVDLSGRTVARLVDGDQAAGMIHRVDWDGTGPEGSLLPDGLYFCFLRVQTKDEGLRRVQKIWLQRNP